MLEQLDKVEIASMAHAAKSGPKFKPNANVARLKDRVGHGSSMSDTTSQSDPMDTDEIDERGYIYDTYVLQDATDFDINAASASRVGILVITEEDQPIWQTYLDDAESDEEQRSDEEDSNAEDYYGADYPEDELDSDDEKDIDAYQYRHGASDDEAYGSDDDYVAYSGGEDSVTN